MTYDSFEDFQYDSCVSRGLCSINPRTSALQGVLLLYLKLSAKYMLKLYKENLIDESAKQLILNTIAITVSNPEFTESSFVSTVVNFKKELPKIIETYNEKYGTNDFEEESLLASELFRDSEDIIEAIRYGERTFRKAVESVPAQIRDLYQIMLVIAKSLSINLLDLESFEKNYTDAFITILTLLDSINTEERDTQKLINSIYDAAKVDNQLMRLLRDAQEERYGKQTANDVSYTTTPSKAALVVGSNIRELETVLEALKDEEIDVYTHDDMMLAHTFPKFSQYEKLKGQYGQGLENCLLDFATFPGSILLTKNARTNNEYLYRGRLFSNDYIVPSGVIKIENDDYTPVIETTLMAKGFSKGKIKDNTVIGYNENEISEKFDKIIEKLNSNSLKKLYIIGLDAHSENQKEYFHEFFSKLHENEFAISFGYESKKDNVLTINIGNYVPLATNILKKLFDRYSITSDKIVFFFTTCDVMTISSIVTLSSLEAKNIYMAQCPPTLVNPSVYETFNKTFKINTTTTAKEDLQKIRNEKSTQ